MKWGSATAVVPTVVASHVRLDEDPPEVGDMVLRRWRNSASIAGWRGGNGSAKPCIRRPIVGVLGHRYAPGQFEGYAENDGGRLHVLSVAGVLGTVRSRHADIGGPTRLGRLG